jgi:hypothetical protein
MTDADRLPDDTGALKGLRFGCGRERALKCPQQG